MCCFLTKPAVCGTPAMPEEKNRNYSRTLQELEQIPDIRRRRREAVDYDCRIRKCRHQHHVGRKSHETN